MILLSVIIFLLLIAIGFLVYALKLSVRKIEIYESFILKRQIAYERLLYRIREIDQKEMFEKDEDVGVVFSDIKNEIEEFDKIIE